ncbi:MAG: TetR/AcrR family transcriptional regulator [Gammaproteobacteria bacterium]|nr:TetR/AcrR family transcriptional regulator [Gammaproteobacteria bacterium]MYD00579.1 TetR/AcrR family transcriptional regulator [Gammaproteobacteria bacterium]
MAIQRSDIRSHATELYLCGGLRALSMRNLAARLGVTAPALYRHYASKDEVLRDMVREAYRQSASYIYRALSAATPLERFLRAGEENLDFALTHPRWYEMMYLSPERFGWPDYPPEVAAHAQATHQFWMDRVRECVDAGYLRAEADIRDVGMTMWAHSHGLITIYMRGLLDLSEAQFREAYRASARRMLLGLGTRKLLSEVRDAGQGELNRAGETEENRKTEYSEAYG